MRLGLAKMSQSSPLQFFSLDELNSYYVSVSNIHPPATFLDTVHAISSISRHSFHFAFSGVSECSIAQLLFTGPPHSYSSGADGVPVCVLRMAWPIISLLITKLFNLSLETSTFPSEWKKAIIRLLSKVRIPASPSETRPIANLSELSKILEKIVHSQISTFLADYNILNPRQSAYRPHHNTQTALLRVTNDIKFAIDRKLITIMVLFDFSKAFDTVPLLNLLIKLKRIGFSNTVVWWLHSYLSGRIQAVFDDAENSSSWLCTTSGVPQGSVLGPLLFSLYINDVGDALSHSNYMIFADDIQIYVSCPPANVIHGLELVMQAAISLSKYVFLMAYFSILQNKKSLSLVALRLHQILILISCHLLL